MKRIVSVMTAIVLVLMMGIPAFAAGTITPNTSTTTYYLKGKTGTSYVYVELAYGTKAFTMKRSDVKVTPGSTGARFITFYKDINNYGYDNYENGKWTSSSTNYNSYEACLSVSKAGTATIAYKIGTKSYKAKAKILAYKNPAKSVVLTGVNSDKSFASLTSSSNNASKSLALKADKASAKLTVKPVSGWKIRSVALSDNSNATEKSIVNYNGLSTAQINCGTLSASHNYEIRVIFYNTSNKATMTCSYSIKGAKAK